MRVKFLNWSQAVFFLIFLSLAALNLYLLASICRADVVLVTPYKNDADISSINQAYSQDKCCPWGFSHLGIDFLTSGEPKPFQAVCSGNVERIEKYDNPGNGYWQVNVSILCDDAAYWVGYAFEIWSDDESEANNQINNILSYIGEGQSVSQGQIIGDLYSLGDGAHVHFGFRKNGADSCPEPYFNSAAKASILNILRDSTRPVFYPDANICYGVSQVVAEAMITMDGSANDWDGISPMASDHEDDGQYLEGDDIKALYIAKDSQHLYLRMDLWENANPEFGNGTSPHQGRYSFSLSSDCLYPNLYFSVAGGYSSEGWSLGYNNSNGSETPDILDNRPDLAGVDGSVIELKIPFSIIGRPSNIHRLYGEVVDCCVPNWTTMDETHCVSHLTIPETPVTLYVTSDDGDCGGKEPCYNSIQEAINDAENGSVILIAGGTYTEAFQLNQPKALVLQGGWNSSFDTQNFGTTLTRAPQVSQGAITLKELKIKSDVN